MEELVNEKSKEKINKSKATLKEIYSDLGDDSPIPACELTSLVLSF